MPSHAMHPTRGIIHRGGTEEGDARRRRENDREGGKRRRIPNVHLDVHRLRRDDLRDDVDERARGIRETDRARARGSIDG